MSSQRSPKRPAQQLGPVWLVLIAIASVQVGAAVAKDLFDTISPTSMVWLRLGFSALVFTAIARPRLVGRTRSDWLIVIGFAASLGAMNWGIYQSFARIPLGVAVTIEFAGPLTLAVLGSRRRLDLVWVALAAIGVVLLGFETADLDPLGVLYALLAGGAWAAYILLSADTGRRWPGIDGLAVASTLAAAAITIPALLTGGSSLLATPVLLTGAAVALLSSVIPYTCELIALRSIRPAVFSVLMSLEPAAAALAAILVLGELLTPVQWGAIGCVVAASVGATRSGVTHREPAPD